MFSVAFWNRRVTRFKSQVLSLNPVFLSGYESWGKCLHLPAHFLHCRVGLKTPSTYKRLLYNTQLYFSMGCAHMQNAGKPKQVSKLSMGWDYFELWFPSFQMAGSLTSLNPELLEHWLSCLVYISQEGMLSHGLLSSMLRVVSDSGFLGWSLTMCLLNKIPGDGDSSGLEPHLKKSLFSSFC